MAVALAWRVGAPREPAAAPAAAVDLTAFELEVLSGWLQGFQVTTAKLFTVNQLNFKYAAVSKRSDDGHDHRQGATSCTEPGCRDGHLSEPIACLQLTKQL